MLRRLTTTAALLGLGAALTACGADNPKPTPLTPNGPASSSAPSEPDTQAAGEAAVAAYRQYIAVADSMAKSGGTQTSDLPSITADEELTTLQAQAQDYRSRKVKATGPTEIRWAKVSRVGDPVAGQITDAAVQACLDTSKTAFVDAAGKAVRQPGTPTKYLDSRTLKFADGHWKVVYGDNRISDC